MREIFVVERVTYFKISFTYRPYIMNQYIIACMSSFLECTKHTQAKLSNNLKMGNKTKTQKV